MAMTTPPLSQLLADAPETFSLSELGGESWSATQCVAHLAEVVESAAALGLAQRHRIGLLAPDTALTPLVTLGLMERARVVPLNPALTPSELDTILKDAALDAVIVADGAPTGHRFTLPCLALRGVRLTGPALPPPPQDRADAAPGLLLLTSGSTGAPKRVYLTFDQLLHSARTIAATLGLSPQDRTLHALPMFHIGAVVDLFLAPLVSGGAVVVSADRSAAGLARGVREGGATWMQTVPTMLAQCLTHWSAEEAATLGAGLRCVRSVSSDLAPAMQAAAEAHLGGTPVIQMYGLTETAGQVASNPLPPAARKPGSVGQVNGAEVTITDANGSPLPAGAEGEICVRGPTVTSGYEGVPREAHFFGAWLRTGDMGRLDADGFLTLTGRKKEMINRGGEKIAPVEVERAVLQIEGVAEAAAFALPHPSLGEQVGLAVVLRPGSGLDEAALIDAVKPHL
ncbi:MAG: AMP-binding protein, partial [Pseudomonadota bacterium]